MAKIIEISGLDAPELDVYARLNERQLSAFFEPENGLFVAESPNVILRALDAGYEPVSLLMERRHVNGQAKEVIERAGAVPVYTGDEEILRQLTGFLLTRGVLCAMRRRTLPEPEEILQGAGRIAILENVENPTNVGALMRSAAALRMDAVLLTPGSADPLYRRAARVSMGTVFQVPWTYIGKKTEDWPEKGQQLLKQLGFKTVAMALSDRAVSIEDPMLRQEEKLAIVLGTEGEGLKKETIAACDYIVKIPMSHGVDSLNVAAAGAVAFWELSKREVI